MHTADLRTLTPLGDGGAEWGVVQQCFQSGAPVRAFAFCRSVVRAPPGSGNPAR
ncbi:hypothetical protein OIE52_45640 [Streptomyces canus]|uniref:hypothetical protein n=1 Tax=Streptomyces canus TaxID=58343 RepID=UPI00324C1B76